MSRFSQHRYLNVKEAIEILKTKDEYEILRNYGHGTITHLYSYEPWDKGDERKINEGSFEYKLNLISYLFLKEKMDDNLFNEIKNSVSSFNHNTPAGSYYNIGSSQDYRKITDILAKMVIKPDDFNYNNSSYITELFKAPNFYHSTNDSTLFTFKEADKENKRNIDFGKYAFISGNKLALNYIYQELKLLKKTYQEFVFDELPINQFAIALNHYKSKDNSWPNKDNEDIKNIDSLFYNVDFVMLFASVKTLNKNQTRILELILKDNKLIEKIQKNAGKHNIYTKDKYEQRKSKDVFVLAILNNNSDFINILLDNGYTLNSNEKGLIHSSKMEDRITHIQNSEINTIDIITQKIIEKISGFNIKNLDYVYNMSKEEIESLQKNYNDFKHPIAFGKIINDKKSSLDMYNNKKATIVDTLILKEPYALPALYSKGFENIHPKIEETAFNEIIMNKYNRSRTEESLTDTFTFLEDFLNKQSDKGMNIISNLFSTINSDNPFLYPVFDSYIAEKILKENISPKEKSFLASSSLAIFNQLTPEEINQFFGNEKDSYIKNFTKYYLDTLTEKNSTLPSDVEDNIFLELAKLTINNKDIFSIIKNSAPSFEQNKYDSVIVKLEKSHLKLMTHDFNNVENNIKTQRRL